jgi:hypothetical protein
VIVPFDLIDAGTSFTTAASAADVAVDEVDVEPDAGVDVELLLLPHAAIAPAHTISVGTTSQLLHLSIGPPL